VAKQLIVNADDYGMSRGTVDGIVQCAQAGVISSTTIMATGDAFEYGVERLSELGTISVGVHLNATTGSPLSPVAEVSSLVDSAGQFQPRRELEATLRMNPVEVEAEFRRQIRRVTDAGISISHLDNHHNWVYFAPTYFRLTARLAQELGIPLRFPFGSLTDQRISDIARMSGNTEPDVKEAAASCLAILDEHRVLRTESFWIEFTSIHRSEEYLMQLLSNLPDGVSELCVHPGLESDRQRLELALLLKLTPSALEQHDVELANYKAVKK
jgi:predicted glycoside hydrolase/deacetylase ChbG (UPF0249 family)